jgi:hypothetical protein
MVVKRIIPMFPTTMTKYSKKQEEEWQLKLCASPARIKSITEEWVVLIYGKY